MRRTFSYPDPDLLSSEEMRSRLRIKHCEGKYMQQKILGKSARRGGGGGVSPQLDCKGRRPRYSCFPILRLLFQSNLSAVLSSAIIATNLICSFLLLEILLVRIIIRRLHAVRTVVVGPAKKMKIVAFAPSRSAMRHQFGISYCSNMYVFFKKKFLSPFDLK